MALTKEDLQAIGALLEPIQAGQQAMQADIAAITNRLERVEESLQIVRTSQMKTELEQFPKIAAALDGMKGLQEKFDKLDRLEAKQEDHGNRILALEFAVQAK